MDIDYLELFGLTPKEPEQTPAEEPKQEPKEEPKQEPTETEKTAEQAKQPAEPKQEPKDTQKQEPEEEPEPKQKTAQTPEENAAYAAARRKAERERDAAIAQAKAETEAAVNDVFAKSGFVNPYTGSPITTKAQFDAYVKQRDEEAERENAERRERELKRAGISGDTIAEIVAQHPAVVEARAAAEEARRRDAMQRQADARARIDKEVEEISKLDDSIKSLEDLSKAECFPQCVDLVKRGYSLTHAYTLVNADKLREAAIAQRVKKGVQAELNKRSNKDHLQGTTQRGGGTERVSNDIIKEFRVLNPEATVEDIQKYYDKYKKSIGQG
jgi:hypothetical protein